MGAHRSAVQLLRYVAAHYQHKHNHHHVSDGLRHSNRDGAAIQAKLDELIRVSAARNTLIGIETLTQDEIEEIRATCAAKAHRAVNGAQKETNKKVKVPVSKAMS
jgi:low affinity Fe/Cu permease